MTCLKRTTTLVHPAWIALGLFGQACIIQGDVTPSDEAATSSSSTASSSWTDTATTTETSGTSAGTSTTASKAETSSVDTSSSASNDASSGSTDSTGTDTQDPFLWLEELETPKSIEWVKEQNKQTARAFTESAEFGSIKTKLTALLNQDNRVVEIDKVGDAVFNFWQDKGHPIGIWRKTTLESYKSKKPVWTTVLDLDQLAKDEKKNWVWKRADCLGGSSTRCMLVLSDGGKDAVVHREFDVANAAFVQNGFVIPEVKGKVSWIDKDHLLVGTSFGADTATKSGYPRQIRRWTRGEELKNAKVVFEGETSDNVSRAYHIESKGVSRDYIHRMVSRFEHEHYLLKSDDTVAKIEVPKSSRLHFWGPWMIIELKEDWKVNDKQWPKGSVLATDQDAFMQGKRSFQALFTPTKARSFQGVAMTKSHLLLTEMQDVKGRLREWSFETDKGWKEREVKVPESGSFTVKSYDPNGENFYSITYSDYLTPPTLFWARSGTDLREELYSLPAAFDAKGFEVQQYFATSKDGTKIPYFQISKKDIKLDKNNPTLLYGYGGFQISIKPKYSPLVGAAWLEQGGVYVVANIRGGGEYGPAWHQAALREKRPRAYEDFVAVGQDLVQRGVTQAKRLGVLGRSNGGLMTGVMLTAYPEQWGAVVSQVPLLDMKRFHKLLAGALWRGEYGDPDVAQDWAYLSKYSPYQNIKPGQPLPPSLFTTSTNDDRVHPAHARKMVAQLQATGYANANLYENTEGGHGGASTSGQTAHLNALVYTFLAKQLGLK